MHLPSLSAVWFSDAIVPLHGDILGIFELSDTCARVFNGGRHGITVRQHMPIDGRALFYIRGHAKG